MDQEIKKRLDALPERIRMSSLSDRASDAVGRIREEYIGMDLENLDKLKNIVGRVFLKDVKVEDLQNQIKNSFVLDDKEITEVTLIIIFEILFPVRDFFPGIEDVVLKLGGEIPKDGNSISFVEQLTKREKEIEDMQTKKEEEKKAQYEKSIVYYDIDSLMKNFPNAADQTIGSQSSIEVKDLPVPMKPMIKYWIEDYRRKNGYGGSSNLERVRYACHDKNTRNMNSEERRQLMLVLKSADGEIKLPYSFLRDKIDFSLVEE